MTVATCDATVVIPTRNRATVLPGALRSALSQLEVSVEVIVVDEASTDETAEVVNGIGDERVRLVRHDTPRGVAAARNRAASEANGEWLAFLDDDDLWSPTWLRTALEAARSADAGAVYGSRWVVDGTRRVIDAWPASRVQDIPATLGEFNALGGPSGVVLRADVFAAAGRFDERLSALADWDLWLRVLDVSHAAAVPEFLVAYTIYPDNMHIRNPFGYLAEFDRFEGIIAGRLGSIRHLDKRRFVRWLAAECDRAGRRRPAARLWLQSARLGRSPEDAVRAVLSLTRDGAPPRGAVAAPDWISARAHAVL